MCGDDAGRGHVGRDFKEFSMFTKKVAVKALALFVWAGCSAMAAHAQTESPYLGAAVSEVSSETGIKLFGGARFNQNIGWEASFMKVKDLKVLSGFMTGHLPFHPNFTAFGKLGINRLSGGGASDTELGFGIGLNWAFLPQVAARIEYEDLGCRGDCDAVSLGVQFKF